MSILFRYYPGDGALNLFLVVALGVTLTSSVAWLVARRLAGNGALRHLILFSGLMCCLAFPAVAWFFSAADLTLVSIPIIGTKQSEWASQAPPFQSDSTRIPPQQLHDPPIAAEMRSPQTNRVTDQSANVAVRVAQNPAASVSAAQERIQTETASATTLSYREIATGMMFLSAAGTLLMLARLARNSWRVVQLRRSSRPVQNARLQILLREVVAKLGMHQIPLVLVSTRTVIPLAVGFGRPAVILPDQLLEVVGDNELRDVLIHEVAHIQRSHQWIVLLQELVAAMYWPIASVHLLNRELRRANEDLCDNVVLASRDAISYGETLLRVAELLVHARPMRAAVGIIGGAGKLEQRIATLIDPQRNLSTTTGRKAAMVVMIIFAAVCGSTSATRFAASATAAEFASQSVTNAPAQEADAKQATASADPDDPKLAGRFSGQVTGHDGKPIRGARVFILPMGDGPDVERTTEAKQNVLKVRAETDGDGRFEFDAPDIVVTDLDGLPTHERCVVIATADGYGPDWRRIPGRTGIWGGRVIRNPVSRTKIALQLAPDVPIRGRFLDPDGSPLAGARVQLTQLMIPKQRDLNTYIDYLARDGSALMNGPGYERSLSLPIPLPGLTTETRTDADGRFTLKGLGGDRLAELMVEAPGVVDTTVTVMTRETPEIGTNGGPTRVTYGAAFTLQLKRGLTVTGQVRDRATQQPIPGMWVGLRWDPFNGLLSGQYSRMTDADGRFTITGLNARFLERDKPSREVMAVSAPGLPYQTAGAEVQSDSTVLIECARGIPFRLTLLDENGRPVAAEVTYRAVRPNPHLPSMRYVYDGRWPISRAAHRGGGKYEGFVLPGPGALLVKTPASASYRPAHVDPKAFFAPNRTDWTAQEQMFSYGTKDTVSIASSSTTHVNQDDYAAIVLVNPPQDSEPLELSATVFKDRPRRVSLIDPDGQPVVGVKTKGMAQHSYDSDTVLRTASFPLKRLHPDRIRRITFIHEDRQLIGFLEARGDGDTPYTVRMRPRKSIASAR